MANCLAFFKPVEFDQGTMFHHPTSHIIRKSNKLSSKNVICDKVYYSTVTDFARLRGLSTSKPRSNDA